MPEQRDDGGEFSQVSRHGHERKTLSQWRVERGWTRMQLAVAAGVTLSTIDNLELARTQPSLETARKLAEALDVYIEQIEWLGTSNQPASKRYRRIFSAQVQVEMAAAIFRVIHENKPQGEALAELTQALSTMSGVTESDIEAALDQVQRILATEQKKRKP